MDPKGLSRKRDITHLLHTSGLRGNRDRSLKQLSPVPGGDRELKAREQDADDHHERMFA